LIFFLNQSSLVFFRYLCRTANIPFVFMVQWKNHGKHYARLSATERRGSLHFTLPYVVVLAWKLSLSLSWLASCMRASLALGFGLSGWVALFLLTPLFFFGCEGIWYDESLLGGMAMGVMTCGRLKDEIRGICMYGY
jgi:hypothetical protein